MQLPIKVGIGGFIGLLVGIIFGWIGFPALLKHKIMSAVALKEGSEIRMLYTQTPFPLDFKIYIFNVTNPVEVQNGDPPVLLEVGPYVYEEWKEKINLRDNEQDDTLTYNPKNTFIFNPKKSGRLTGDEIVTIPHPIIVGLAMTIALTKPAMISFISKAINGLFTNPDSFFITAPVKDLFFDGILINCTQTEFAPKSTCAAMKTKPSLKRIAEDILTFSFFGLVNATAKNTFTVKRGIKKATDLGRVIQFNNKSEMDIWPTKECNKYIGTDSTIFPPFLKEEEGIWSFQPDICRSLGAMYEKSLVYKGIPVRKYNATLGDMSTDESLKCFCPSPKKCLKHGLMDISKCVDGAPIVVSMPHFYDSHPSYLEAVRGLRPKEEEHGTFIYFEPITGTPLAAAKRLQFNMQLIKIDKIELFKNIEETIFPIIWVEESVELNSTYIDQLNSQLFRTLKIMGVVKWLIVIASAGTVAISIFIHFKKNSGFSVTPMSNGNLATNIQPQKSSIVSTVGGTNGMEKF